MTRARPARPAAAAHASAAALYQRVAAADVAGARRLLASGADVNAAIPGVDPPGTTTLMMACWKPDSLELVTLLLSAGADPGAADAEGQTALIVATYTGTEAVVSALLAAGADPKAAGGKALVIAADLGRAAVVSTLLASGADHKQRPANGTALHAAAMKGHKAAVSVLLAAGADPDAADNGGATPLMGAAQEGHVSVVEALLAAGADLKPTNDRGATALMLAAMHRGCEATVRLLLVAGADVQAASHGGSTALMFAAQSGHQGVVQMLLAAGAETSSANSAGVTALMKAAGAGQAAVVSVLLAAGADPTARARDGFTAHFVAGPFRGIQEMLQKAMTSRAQQPIRGPDAMEAASAAADAVAAMLIADEEADKAKPGDITQHMKQKAKKAKESQPLSTPRSEASAAVMAPGVLAATEESVAAGPSNATPVDLSQAQRLPADAGLSTVAGGAMCIPSTSPAATLRPTAVGGEDSSHDINQTKPRGEAEGSGRPTRSCSSCGLTGSSMQKCAGCQVARYCSPQCQKKDWREGGHKAACAGLKAQRGG